MMKNIKTYEEYKGETFEEYLDGCKYSLNTNSIDCSQQSILDLNGIDKFVNLELLYSSYNKLTNFLDLKDSKNLIHIDVNYNKITSLKGIENLTELKTLFCNGNPIDWVDYIDKQGNKWYIELPKSIDWLQSDKFKNIDEYWEFFNKNQPAVISRKFNF